MDEKPTFYSTRSIPVGGRDEFKAAWKEMRDRQRQSGATFFRYTVFSDEYPSDIYPHGFYLEGWETPPRNQPPFEWPMTSTKDGVKLESSNPTE